MDTALRFHIGDINQDFQALQHEYYQFLQDAGYGNHVPKGKENFLKAIVIYDEEQPVACGAIKKVDNDTVEYKRMWIRQEARKKGIATRLLTKGFDVVKDLGYRRIIFQTSRDFKYPFEKYEAMGFRYIEPFEDPTAICMEKVF